jgi:hypothetical protein
MTSTIPTKSSAAQTAALIDGSSIRATRADNRQAKSMMPPASLSNPYDLTAGLTASVMMGNSRRRAGVAQAIRYCGPMAGDADIALWAASSTR